MTHIVILGGGFAGLTVYHHLSHWIKEADVSVTVIDARETFLIKPSLPEVAFGDKTLGQSTFPIRSVVERHGRFILAQVLGIDPVHQRVRLDGAEIPYDFLVIALGAYKDWDAVPGFAEFGYSMCTDALAPRLGEALEKFRGGNILVGSAPTPSGTRLPDVPKLATACEGPVGEVAFMADHWLRQKHLREQTDIICYTPGSVFFDDVGDNVHRAFGDLAHKQNVKVMTGKTIERMDADQVYFADGTHYPSALTVLVPTYRGPQVVVDAGLCDEAGFIPTDQQFRHLDYDTIFAVGDIAARTQPKIGHLAVDQGILVASVLRQAITGAGPLAAYHPEVFCIMNMGSTALIIRSNVLWGGEMDLSYYGHLSHALKTAFDEYTLRFKGKMPPEITTKLLNSYLKKMAASGE